MFSPNLATVNYFHTDAIFMAACCVHDYWVDITSYVISYKKGQFLSQVWQQIEVQGSEGDGAQELGDQGWKYLEATDPVNLGIWVNSGNCQLFRFHNTENKATTLDDSKSWTTIQKLGSSKISPYTRCSQSFQKKTTICRILFQFGEHAAFWGLREQADPDKDLQCQLYLHLWPHMVASFFTLSPPQ